VVSGGRESAASGLGGGATMSTAVRPEGLGRYGEWDRVRVVVLGIGVSGFAAADSLLHLGAHVTVLAEGAGDAQREKADLLEVLGATVRIGPGATAALPTDADLVVTSPGLPPTAPALVAAGRGGVPVWGEVELAWRLRDPEHPGEWLCVTGTNGKTTTVQMLEAVVRASGLVGVACGNVGLAAVEAVMDPTPYAVYAVELSSFQLHYTHSLSPWAAAVLNVAEDHLDWYSGPHAMADYAADKGRVYERVRSACVYNVADPLTERLVRAADVVEGARAVGFTLGTPEPSMVGVVDDVLADRAFLEDRRHSALELCTVADLASPAPHFVANALAAAALARSVGVPPAAVRDGLRSFTPGGHRIADLGTVAGVRYVDDSKATNPAAATSSLQAYEPVVWVAGGLAKGARFDDLVSAVGHRLRGVVLLGRDRAVIAEALARHAPDVPVIEVVAGETGVMDRVVEAGAQLAQPGDTVLLAPGCASMDMFANYGARGDAFAESVRRLRDR
jgi:UDP-N-acetylmuramoylalanine--D-glutamate ligase